MSLSFCVYQNYVAAHLGRVCQVFMHLKPLAGRSNRKSAMYRRVTELATQNWQNQLSFLDSSKIVQQGLAPDILKKPRGSLQRMLNSCLLRICVRPDKPFEKHQSGITHADAFVESRYLASPASKETWP